MVPPFPPARADHLLSVALLATLFVVAIAVAHGGAPIAPLPALNGAESWALETVALIGLCAWYAASLAGGRTTCAANDNAPAGYGGLPAPTAD